MDSLKVTGRLKAVFPAQQKTDKFTSRRFWLEVATEINGTVYTNFAELQLVNQKCSLIDQYQVGQPITVHFNLKGNLWNSPQGEKCINTLDAWKIEAVGAAPQQGNQQQWQAPAPAQPWQAPAPQQPWQAPAPAQQWQAPAPQQPSFPPPPAEKPPF